MEEENKIEEKNENKKTEKKIDLEKFNNTKEEEVGITEFMCPENPGFKCVLKHRYSDFIVNEIDVNGNVVWLKESNEDINDSNIISSEKKEGEDGKIEQLNEEKAEEIIKKIFSSFLNEKEREDLNKLIVNYIYKQHQINDSIEVNFIEDKEKRRQLHENIREHFPFLDSQTIEDKEIKEKKIKITYMTKQNMFKRRKVFPDKNKNILLFSLLKRNMDTIGAVEYISRLLHRTQKTIKFAGNKDKRGITTQRLSSFNTLPNEIISLTKNKRWNKNLEISNFSFSDKELRLGLLKGNQFCVCFRFVEGLKDIKSDLDLITKSINEKGFINYFGMQRFGVGNVSTHIIGKYIIKKKWKEAFAKIISTDNMFDAMKQVGLGKDVEKEIFDIEDKAKQMTIITDILKILPKFTNESKLLFNYKKCGKNSYQSSFKSLSKQLQVLYPHSYQSYIWNMTVSYRISKYGRKLIIGDIVKKHESLYQEKNQEEDCDIPEEEDKNENNEISEKKLEKMDKIFTDNFDYITEENINKYSFYDLVIPIVGYEIYYPKNDIKNYIEDLLKKDDLSFKDFEYQAVNFNSTGYFRKVIEKPLNVVSYDIIKHDDPDIDLQTPYYNVEPHPKVSGNKYTSIRFVFQLPQSTYATMLFRELTKSSSSGSYQAGLSKNIKESKDN
jgi:tRNA pseudouridine13 synthase